MPLGFPDGTYFFVKGGEAKRMPKKKQKDNEKPIATQQVSVMSPSDKNIFLSNHITYDLLRDICHAKNKFDAIDIIVTQTPDGRQALNTFLRLANQGIEIELKSATTGRVVKKYDTELREFCKTIGKNNACGLDGLVDQLHRSAIARSGMAVEVIVDDDITDIEEVVIVDPATITQFEWIESKKRYAAYQAGLSAKKVDLFDGNFFWIPHNPKPGRPDGTLQFEAAIATITQFYQLIQDGLVILNRIGFPRYKCEIDRAALLESLPAHMKDTAENQQKAFQTAFNQIEENLRRMGKDNDLITFDSVKVDLLGGGVNGSGIDLRSWVEMLEPLIVNSFNLTPVLMGRLNSGSYSLGTAEYSIVCDTIDTMRRESKRMLEEIVNIWARVKGYNVRATVTHNPIDWQTELDKLSVDLKKIEKARRAEEYRWITHDEAAQMGIGVASASEPQQTDMYEFLGNESSNNNLSENSSETNSEQQNNNENGSDKK